jgi:hypothetical protein
MNDLLQCAQASWAPKLGDQTAMGWAITLFYVYTVLLILYMLPKLRRIHPERRKIYTQFWIIVMLIFVVLGLNKQLDLQTFGTATLRCMARLDGWYEQRRNVQVTAILAGIFIGSTGLFGFLYFFRQIAPRCMLAFVGLGIEALFIFLRAVSFHHIDTVFAMSIGDVKVHAIMEILGILLVAMNAIRLAHHRVQRQPREAGAPRKRRSREATSES